MISKTELAWAAGFFDGEGTIGFTRKTTGSCKKWIAIGNTDVELLYRFRTAVYGLGVVRNKYKNQAKGKPIFVWYLNSFEEIQACLSLLYNYFGERNRLRALALLKAIRVKLNRGPKRSEVCPKGHTKEFFDEAWRCRQCKYDNWKRRYYSGAIPQKKIL